jgi:uncharacterized protein (TIGR02246 family)
MMNADLAADDALQFVETLVAAWNQGAADEFAAMFADDATYRMGSGELLAGRNAIRELVVRSGSPSIEAHDVTVVSTAEGFAVTFDWRTASPATDRRKGRITLALRRRDRQLLVVSLANREVR